MGYPEFQGNPRKTPPKDVVIAGSHNSNGGIADKNYAVQQPGSKLRFFDYNFHAMKKSISSVNR